MVLRSILVRLCVLLCLAGTALPVGAQTLAATPYATGFTRPVGIVQDPSNPAVQFVIEQGGRIRVLVDGAVQATDFLDLTSQVASVGEQGLLGLAFAPDYATSGRVFVSFTNPQGHSVIARFTRSTSQPLVGDATSRFDLVWQGGPAFIAQPFANHNGGHIAFGPDGYLYIGLGDGGSGDDPNNNAQNGLSFLGKMLRIDVNVPDTHVNGYVVPADNPFVDNPNVYPEIWSFGFRNPWRWSFDDPDHGGTGAMVIGDVGQAAWEEIDYEPAGMGGRNYGWRNREGAHDHVTTTPPFSTPLIDPLHEYGRALGQAVTGGYVYRGAAVPALAGRYVFGDFSSSRIWSLGLAIDSGSGAATVADVVEHTADLGAAATSPSSFGVNADGELFIVAYTGTIYRVDAAPAGDACTTIQPGPDWTCHNGGWLPPGMAPPGSTPPPTTPPPTTDCTSVQPGPDWTCYNGGWLPPGMTPPGSTPPPTTPPPTTPPPTADCTSVQPGPDWTCYNGGWLPPGMTPPGSTPPPTTPPPTGDCTTIQPGPDWTCDNGGWLPPGMTPPTTPPPTTPPPPGTCTTLQPGPDWVCRNGGWVPPGYPAEG